MANRDGLTKLPSRHKPDADIKQIVNGAMPTTIFYLDFNGFKFINDNFGHGAGDFALYKIAQLISSVLPEGINLYRIGGDEFVALGTIMTRKESEKRAKDINTVSKTNLSYEGNDFSIKGVSIGIVNFPDDAKTKSEILNFADTAMYKAKNTGKSSFAFYRDS